MYIHICIYIYICVYIDIYIHMQMAALGVSTVSIITKEILYHYTLKVGKDSNSDSVKANAWQHRRYIYIYLHIYIYM
jgi:divalent metal cation (Fe/Co/Zn/Cd) transporter